MRFTLIDRITDVQPGKRLEAIKNLTMGEEYLAEHFPGFPVLPGVLMLEAGIQAGACLIRVTEDFAHPLVVLKEAKTVKYGHFVTPGKQLRISCEWAGATGDEVALKIKGELDGNSSISCRMTLQKVSLVSRHPGFAEQEERLRAHHRRLFGLLASPEVRAKIRVETTA